MKTTNRDIVINRTTSPMASPTETQKPANPVVPYTPVSASPSRRPLKV